MCALRQEEIITDRIISDDQTDLSDWDSTGIPFIWYFLTYLYFEVPGLSALNLHLRRREEIVTFLLHMFTRKIESVAFIT